MMNVFAQPSRLRRRACQLPVRMALILTSALILPGTAWASCIAAGTTITCDGNSPSYTNLASGLTVTADSTAVVVAPLAIGPNSSLTVASGGNIQGSTAIPSVQFGDNATITNNGTISSSSSTSGAAAIKVGINSTVTNNGTLTAAAGTPAVIFDTNGTFTNLATATAAVTGNIVYGLNISANIGTFNNNFNATTTFGLNGTVSGSGNMNIYNNGQWTGGLNETYGAGAVNFTNDTKGVFNGVIITGDRTTLVNNAGGTMLVNFGSNVTSSIGTLAVAGTSVTNNGTLTIGSTAAPIQFVVNGAFSQGATGVLNLAIAGTTAPTATAIGGYSQLYAAGANGTVSLAGTLNVNVVPGFFPVHSVYKLIVADNGITGSFGVNDSNVHVLNASNATLPFLTFQNLGVVTVSGTQQAYEFTVTRNGVDAQHPLGSYANVIGLAGTSNQLAIANALEPLFVVANATPTGQEATLLGQIDQLTITQATTLFDQLSPAGLLSYANALRDEANNFERAIQLRMQDQNSDHAEDGWWGSANGQVDVSKATNDSAKQTMLGFNLGYDLSGPHHVFGVAGTVTFDTLKNLGNTLTGHNRDYAVAAYGGYTMGPVHLTGQLAYNFGHLSTTRTLTLGTVTDTANGTASEHLLKATATAGFMLHAGGYTLEPFAGIDYMRGKINGFTETGDGAAALTVLPIKADRTDLLAGLSLTRSSGKLRPYLRATYRSAIGNSGDTTVSAYFDGNSATAFSVVGVPAARHEEDINAGLNWVFEDAGSVFIGYQGTLRSGFNSHGANVGIRLEF
jgi:uncharacterized protein with beta-barrel porin domain